jgi:hypothetical protein
MFWFFGASLCVAHFFIPPQNNLLPPFKIFLKKRWKELFNRRIDINFTCIDRKFSLILEKKLIFSLLLGTFQKNSFVLSNLLSQIRNNTKKQKINEQIPSR